MSLQQPESENLAFPESPKLVALAGDWHGNGSFARAAIESLPRDVDVLVHLGDFGYRFEPAFMEAVNSAAAEAELIIMFVRGNHDDTVITRMPAYANGVVRMLPRVWFLPDSFRWSWHGKTWLALGGAVSLDYAHRDPGLSWWPDETLSIGSAMRAADAGPADVVVAHDVLAGVTVPGLMGHWPADALKLAEDHRELLANVARAVRPSRWFHGHMHVRYDAELDLDGSTLHVTGLSHDSRPRMADNLLVIDPSTMQPH